MIYRGTVKNGVIVLENDAKLPDGTEVKVEPLQPGNTPAAAEEGPSLYDRLKPFIGSAEGLPPDASARIDEYLYGQQNQQQE